VLQLIEFINETILMQISDISCIMQWMGIIVDQHGGIREIRLFVSLSPSLRHSEGAIATEESRSG
jgi:hypothetical protein